MTGFKKIFFLASNVFCWSWFWKRCISYECFRFFIKYVSYLLIKKMLHKDMSQLINMVEAQAQKVIAIFFQVFFQFFIFPLPKWTRFWNKIRELKIWIKYRYRYLLDNKVSNQTKKPTNCPLEIRKKKVPT